MDCCFEGKNALVVGGTSGIGLKLAELLSDSGAHVTVAGRHNPFSPENCTGDFVFADFTDCANDLRFGRLPSEDLQRLFPKVDILTVCYGPFVQQKLEETSAQDWLSMAVQDYALPGIFVSECLKGMIERKWGRILLFGGTRTDSIRSYKTTTAYSGAKTGVSVLTKSVASNYAELGITCNAILPGFTHNAPKNTRPIEDSAFAYHGFYLLSHSELNGVLFNVDRGWQP